MEMASSSDAAKAGSKRKGKAGGAWQSLGLDATLVRAIHSYFDGIRDSATDLPTALFYDELRAAYPSALFVLTMRNATNWWPSAYKQMLPITKSEALQRNRRGAYGSRRNLLEPDALHSFDDSSKGSASVEEPPAEPLSSKVVSVAQRLSQVDEKLELITAALTRSKNRA